MDQSNASATSHSLSILDPALPQDFMIPVKKIHEGHDVSPFHMSRAYNDILLFLLQLNYAMFPRYDHRSETAPKAVLSYDVDSKNIHLSDTVLHLRNLLLTLGTFIDEVPPAAGPRRFGNVSFRRWSQLVEDRALDLFKAHLPADVLAWSSSTDVDAGSELKSYFLGSFGSPQRLDYGSGHELSFLAFLGGIWKLGGFEVSESLNEERSIVVGVIEPYLQLIRRLIKVYTLEPAGSHGVWGLDDHSFLPYILGSAQYSPVITKEGQIPTEGSRTDAPDPGDIAKATVVAKERNRNLYFGAIGFIYDVKKGAFWEHSRQLYDISGVRAGWAKINKGMIKMYNAEVLSKFPVVQHFPFGSLFSWDTDPNGRSQPPSVHTSNQPENPLSGPRPSGTPAVRKPLQESTKAPWATRGAMAMPHPSQSTRLPSLTSTQTNSSNNTTNGSTSSEPTVKSDIPEQPSSKMINTSPNDGSMLPPTRAPWAR